MILRSYQVGCVDSVFKEWEEVKSTLGVLATGGGKTLIAAEVIRRVQPARAMFIAHREELITQARASITGHTDLECGIEMADSYVHTSMFGDVPVVIATVQTLNSRWCGRTRMSRFKPSEFGVLVIDEAHRGIAKTYRNVINYFTQNPKLRILCITATPDRGDEEALGQICDSVAFDIEILDMIHDGYLVPVEQQFVSISGLDFSHMRTTAGDLNGADLSAVMEAESNLQGVAGSLIQIMGKRRTIVFTASVRQAETISCIFNRHQPGMSDWVCGATNKDSRREMLARFQRGDVQVICNCGVLTEGFDNPGVEIIAMARPTKSRSLYAQMAGRSTRPLPRVIDGLDTADERKAAIAASAKPVCTLIDFVGNSGRHKLMSSVDILGGKVSDAACSMTLEMAKKSGQPVRISEELDKAEAKLIEQMRQFKLAEEARRAKIVARVTFTSKQINPFDVYDLVPVKARGWDNTRTLSEKQRIMLRKHLGIDPDTIPYPQARQLIAEQFRRWDEKLCSLKQAACLKRYGYDTKNLSREDASKLMDGLAKNGWKKPQTQHVPLLTTPTPEPDYGPMPF